MKPSMQTLVDQQLLVIPNEKRSYDLAPEDFNDQFKQIMQAYAQIPASATKPIVFSFTSMEALMAWTM